MKFAHEFQAALIREGYPSHWVESAVPYGQLKKCIKKVAGELRSFGLDSTTLAQLIPNPDLDLQTQGSRDAVAFEYDFDGIVLLKSTLRRLKSQLTCCCVR